MTLLVEAPQFYATNHLSNEGKESLTNSWIKKLSGVGNRFYESAYASAFGAAISTVYIPVVAVSAAITAVVGASVDFFIRGVPLAARTTGTILGVGIGVGGSIGVVSSGAMIGVLINSAQYPGISAIVAIGLFALGALSIGVVGSLVGIVITYNKLRVFSATNTLNTLVAPR